MQCVFHRCKEACNVLKSGWSITSIIHHWFRTKYCNVTEVFLLWDASPMISLGPHGLGLATRPHMSRAGSRLRRLESCTVSRPCPCEILNTGLLVKYPGPSWALSLVTHRQAQDAIQARLQAPGGTVMQCWSASANLSTESWRHGSPQSGELILLQMDCELTLNA